MPTATIDQLPSGAPLSGSDLFESLQVSAGQNVSVRVSATQLRNYIQLSGWKLLKKWPNLSSDTIDQSFTSIVGNRIKVVFQGFYIGSSSLRIQFNNDTGANYRRGQITQNGNSVSSTGNVSVSGLEVVVSDAGGYHGYARFEAGLKNTGYRRHSVSHLSQYDSGDSDKNIRIQYCSWTNTASNITSVRLFSGSSTITGEVAIYEWID